MKNIWGVLFFLGCAIIVNAVVALSSWQSFGLLAKRTKAFNRSTVVRVDTEQCRKAEQNRTRCCQCLFEFEKRWPSKPLRFTPSLKVEQGDLGIPTIKGDGEVTDGYSTLIIDSGQIYVNNVPIEVRHAPSFFLIPRKGTVAAFVDSFDAL